MALVAMHISWIMTKKLFTAAPQTTIGEARRSLRSHQIRHLPIVDTGGRLVGILSDRDLRRARGPSRLPVSAVMVDQPIVLHTDSEIEEALDTMLESGVGALPVVGGHGEIVGIVSLGDVIRRLARERADDGARRAPHN
jgi:acetoin utilization protein AcuB